MQRRIEPTRCARQRIPFCIGADGSVDNPDTGCATGRTELRRFRVGAPGGDPLKRFCEMFALEVHRRSSVPAERDQGMAVDAEIVQALHAAEIGEIDNEGRPDDLTA